MARFVEFNQGKRKILINVKTVEGVFVKGGNTTIITGSCVGEDQEWIVDETYSEVKAMLTGKKG